MIWIMGRIKKGIKTPMPTRAKIPKKAAAMIGFCLAQMAIRLGLVSLPALRQTPIIPPMPMTTKIIGNSRTRPNHRLPRTNTACCGLLGFT